VRTAGTEISDFLPFVLRSRRKMRQRLEAPLWQGVSSLSKLTHYPIQWERIGTAALDCFENVPRDRLDHKAERN